MDKIEITKTVARLAIKTTAFAQKPIHYGGLVMNILTDSVLTESKSARENQLAQINEERATEVLNKIKSLYFALWKGEGIATTEEMSDFYEVEAPTIRQIRQRHSEEFSSDGVKTLRGQDFKDVRDTLSLTYRQSSITVWTPRAALRLGMLLRDSIVAKQVRTSLLDVVEKVIPAQTQEIEKLKLELEVAKAQRGAAEAQQKLMAASSALAIINPGLPALVLGKPEAVVTKTEVIEKTVLVNERGKAISSYEGISKTKLAQRYGMKRAKDVVNWLKSIGKEEVLKPGITPAFCQYIPYSEIAELDRLWVSRRGSRQFLIGE